MLAIGIIVAIVIISVVIVPSNIGVSVYFAGKNSNSSPDPSPNPTTPPIPSPEPTVAPTVPPTPPEPFGGSEDDPRRLTAHLGQVP